MYSPSAPPEHRPRKWVVFAAFGVLLLVIGALWQFNRQPLAIAAREPRDRPVSTLPPLPPPFPATEPAAPGDPEFAARAVGDEGSSGSGLEPEQELEFVGPLVEMLRAPLTPDGIRAWHEQLNRLRLQGRGGIAEIEAFLATGEDVRFADLENGSALGGDSLRLSLLEVLAELGGPDALRVARDVLGTTTVPREIAMAAYIMDTEAPGQQRAEVLRAIDSVLEEGPRQEVAGPESDLNPVFELLQGYGGEEAVGRLESAAAQWRYYALMSLAAVPQGEGIPALVDLVLESGNQATSGFALGFLAQSAGDYESARGALLDQARLGRIPESAWRGIAEGLSGVQWQFQRAFFENAALDLVDPTRARFYNVRFGNQNFYTVDRVGRWTPDQLRAQLEVVETLLDLSASPSAHRYLTTARESLIVALGR